MVSRTSSPFRRYDVAAASSLRVATAARFLRWLRVPGGSLPPVQPSPHEPQPKARVGAATAAWRPQALTCLAHAEGLCALARTCELRVLKPGLRADLSL